MFTTMGFISADVVEAHGEEISEAPSHVPFFHKTSTPVQDYTIEK